MKRLIHSLKSQSIGVVALFVALGGTGYAAISIPKNSVVKYESALKSDKFLLLAHGTASEVAKARDIIQTTRPVEVNVHTAEREQPAEVSGI